MIGRTARQVFDRAIQYDCQQFLPALVGHLEESDVPQDDRVVHEHVDTAKLGAGLLDHRVDGGRVADVGRDRDGTAPQGPDPPRPRRSPRPDSIAR